MKYRLPTLITISFAILFVPGVVRSCGPFLEYAQFTTYGGPFPGEFSSGRFGVLRPSYTHADLLLAYRTLSGVPLTPDEVPSAPLSDGANPWLAARSKVPGVQPLDEINADKKIAGDDFESYPNCLQPAFVTAAETLKSRMATWGASSPQLAEWVRGQDTVFSNCSGGPYIPARVPGAVALLAADREYQIAAAEFYAGQLEKAEADFDRIAADRTSPWHDIAAYVAARACIRQGTLGKNEAKLKEAASRLRDIADDPARGKLRDSASDLLNFIRAQTEPEERLTEIGKEITKPHLGIKIQQMLVDYTDIWYEMETAGHPPVAGKTDATDWVMAVQNGGQPVAKWRETHKLPWLVAGLMWAESEKDSGDFHDLIDAAHALKPESPAYPTATYYGILRQIQLGETDAARRWADMALARNEPDHIANLFRGERMKLARNWTEFLKYAPRMPVSSSDGVGGTEFPMAKDDLRHDWSFDEDAVEAFNKAVPLSLWLNATSNPLLTRDLQAQIAQAGWVRAVILGDQSAARPLAERLRTLQPELKAEMSTYLATKDAAAANFNAVYLMLHAPGFEPQVRSGSGRETDILKRDELRDNWWNLTTHRMYYADTSVNPAQFDLYPKEPFYPEGFLPPDQRQAGDAEWAKIGALAGKSVDYLCGQAIAWAKAHPDEPRNPHALYLCVEATHYGPTEPKNPYSKQAFDLLHKRYPKSEWATKTKYYY